MKERVVSLDRDGTRFGLLSEPDPPAAAGGGLAIVLLNSGIVHRVGPNRIYVRLARALADRGVGVLRFDFSGIGDSDPREDGLPIEKSAELEAIEAVDSLAGLGFGRFCLMGLCSGAGFAFRAALRDPRVHGVGLINAAGHRWGSAREFGRTMLRHYVRIATRAPFRGKIASKMLRVRFDVGLAMRLLGSLATGTLSSRGDEAEPIAASAVRDLHDLLARGTRVLIVYSEGDEGLDYFRAFLGDDVEELERAGSFTAEIIPGANHVFSLLESQREMIDVVTRWAIPPGEECP